MSSTTHFQATDLHEPYSHLFNSAAKKAFERKVNALNPEREIVYPTTLQSKTVDTVTFLAVIAVGAEKMHEAAQIISAEINTLAEEGSVTGVMVPMVYIKLVTEPHELEKRIVMMAVSLSKEGLAHLKERLPDLIIKEGETPKIVVK